MIKLTFQISLFGDKIQKKTIFPQNKGKKRRLLSFSFRISSQTNPSNQKQPTSTQRRDCINNEKQDENAKFIFCCNWCIQWKMQNFVKTARTMMFPFSGSAPCRLVVGCYQRLLQIAVGCLNDCWPSLASSSNLMLNSSLESRSSQWAVTEFFSQLWIWTI